MEYEDRISIATPEGVELELALAGVGSRFVALLLDLLIKGLLIAAVAAAFALGGALATDGALGLAALVVVAFLEMFAYDVAFETLAAGRTPGKRWTGLRVVRLDGRPIDLRTSAVRNLLRALEGYPTLYLPAIVSVLATSRNQRLGDLAAGTLVVRERRAGTAFPGWRPTAPPREAATWDVSAISADEVAAVRGYLARRFELEEGPRRQLAEELAARLRPKVAGASDSLPSDDFLEALVAAKATRG